jgi:hypothetical protein
VRRSYSTANIRPYHILPFVSAALINFGDLSVCPLLRLFVDRLTVGLYHLLLNGVAPNRRDGYQTYVGRVFEDYVDELFRRAYAGTQPNDRVRYFNEAELRVVLPAKKGAPPRVCDGLILDGDRVVLLETKAQLLPAAARAGDDQALFFDRMHEMFDRSARQLDATIQHVRAGHFIPLGVDPKRVRAYLPVIVTLQELPMSPILYRWIARRFGSAELLRGADVRPFQHLYIGNLEQLEVALSEGHSLAAILEEKCADQDGVWEGFANYAWRTGKPATQGDKNTYLAARYRAIFDQALAYLRSRARNPSDPDLALPE